MEKLSRSLSAEFFLKNKNTRSLINKLLNFVIEMKKKINNMSFMLLLNKKYAQKRGTHGRGKETILNNFLEENRQRKSIVSLICVLSRATKKERERIKEER